MNIYTDRTGQPTLQEFKELPPDEIIEQWERMRPTDSTGTDGNGFQEIDILAMDRNKAYYYIFQ